MSVRFTADEALEYHARRQGKLSVIAKTPLSDMRDMSLAYSPGVAEPCRAIEKSPERVYDYTNKGNAVAVVSDGSAVLGLGDIGPEAGLPVMEGKAVLLKMLAGVDAYPICLRTKDIDEIVRTVKALEPSFGGFNLEDIASPRCFEIERRLKEEIKLPLMHDDQHGTAIVTLAGLINALKVVGKDIGDVRIIFNGAGAAALACAKFYLSAGVNDVIMCDTKGTIYEGRTEGMNPYKHEIAKETNKGGIEGSLADAMAGADIFVGLSVGNVVSEEMVRSMGKDAIVFACANPDPEIAPEKALAAGARVVATGRSDYPNQINNVLGFPGIFRGALDVRAKCINEEMKMAAAHAIASLVRDDELSKECIITNPLNPEVVPAVASAVADAAMRSDVARRRVKPGEVAKNVRAMVEEAQRVYKAFG
ncbi:MAG: malic enzyme-like NAD(P)-binding protein [Candidatus Altiarchaeota archaeon]